MNRKYISIDATWLDVHILGFQKPAIEQLGSGAMVRIPRNINYLPKFESKFEFTLFYY